MKRVCVSSLSGNKDVGGHSDPVRPALDALQDSGFDKLLRDDALPERLVCAVLSDVHLRQQRDKPRHIQRHVSEIPLCISGAVPLPTAGGKSEDAVDDSSRL